MAKKKERIIPEVLLFTDINNGYFDDLAALPVLAYLADKKQINLRGVITERGLFAIRRRRALYAKGALSFAGLPFTRVVPGGDYEVQNTEVENNYPENEFSLLFEQNGAAILRSGMTFIQEYFKSVKDKRIVILLNAPFADFAKFMQSTEDVVKKKVKKIVVMGDVADTKAENGYYLPNPQSFNFSSLAAAEQVFAYAQSKDVRLVIVPPQSVKDMKMGYEFLDAVPKVKNPLVNQLLQAKNDNPVSMQYDMLSALATADGEFKRAGGNFVKEEGFEGNVFFAKVEDAQLMRDKFTEIFKEKFTPQKITLSQLTRKKEDVENA